MTRTDHNDIYNDLRFTIQNLRGLASELRKSIAEGTLSMEHAMVMRDNIKKLYEDSDRLYAFHMETRDDTQHNQPKNPIHNIPSDTDTPPFETGTVLNRIRLYLNYMNRPLSTKELKELMPDVKHGTIRVTCSNAKNRGYLIHQNMKYCLPPIESINTDAATIEDIIVKHLTFHAPASAWSIARIEGLNFSSVSAKLQSLIDMDIVTRTANSTQNMYKLVNQTPTLKEITDDISKE